MILFHSNQIYSRYRSLAQRARSLALVARSSSRKFRRAALAGVASLVSEGFAIPRGAGGFGRWSQRTAGAHRNLRLDTVPARSSNRAMNIFD